MPGGDGLCQRRAPSQYLSLDDATYFSTQHLLCSGLSVSSYLLGGDLLCKDKVPSLHWSHVMSGFGNRPVGIREKETQGKDINGKSKGDACPQISPASPPGTASLRCREHSMTGTASHGVAPFSVTGRKMALPCQQRSPRLEDQTSEQGDVKPEMGDS